MQAESQCIWAYNTQYKYCSDENVELKKVTNHIVLTFMTAASKLSRP